MPSNRLPRRILYMENYSTGSGCWVAQSQAHREGGVKNGASAPGPENPKGAWGS